MLTPTNQPTTSVQMGSSVLDKLYAAHGRTEGYPDMSWTVCLGGRVLEIDTGLKSIRLNRGEAIALLECLNAALPHIAV